MLPRLATGVSFWMLGKKQQFATLRSDQKRSMQTALQGSWRCFTGEFVSFMTKHWDFLFNSSKLSLACCSNCFLCQTRTHWYNSLCIAWMHQISVEGAPYRNNDFRCSGRFWCVYTLLAQFSSQIWSLPTLCATKLFISQGLDTYWHKRTKTKPTEAIEL